ncbi:MAG: amidohydrolase [Deltaproteobacteria bacterium]|nr:amidohydrolase [Deltaproteobacteria bacterium]MBW2444571.1 amidohydrolase [Deltaproteobacteria bacterium]
MRRTLASTTLASIVLAASVFAPPVAAEPSADPVAAVEARRARSAELAARLWDWAELGYLEEKSSKLLRDELAGAGFRIRSGVADIPTAFVAEWGEGEPVIGILAEFDALPGLSQAAVPRREPRVDGAAGQACGHHLFGAGSTAAALAVREWLEARGGSGTIRLYGTPAEEGGSGKVYMARAGLFEDVAAVFHWHPDDENDASPYSTLANRSAKFRFRGVAAHASAAPHRGRSALDGVEAMNHMVNLLREHVPSTVRIHYVITQGGLAPNVVPERAEVFYYVRHPTARGLLEVWPRVEAAARGAALGTGTDVEWEVIHGNHPVLPNETLARVMDQALRRVGGPVWDESDRVFAAELAATLPASTRDPSEIAPFAPQSRQGSTDVGDLSWLVPTTSVRTATWVPGTSAHTWQAVAAGGTGVGEKGMTVAAKTLALAAVALYEQPELLAEAHAEMLRRRGADFDYQPLLGDRDPPLDYRR